MIGTPEYNRCIPSFIVYAWHHFGNLTQKAKMTIVIQLNGNFLCYFDGTSFSIVYVI